MNALSTRWPSPRPSPFLPESEGRGSRHVRFILPAYSQSWTSSVSVNAILPSAAKRRKEAGAPSVAEAD